MSMWDMDFDEKGELVEDTPEEEIQEEDEMDDSDSPSVDEYLQDIGIDDTIYEREEEIKNNAKIRLEQGRLYDMLLSHNLFEGVDSVPEAIENVQSEIKAFILERLEILLGMKEDKRRSAAPVAPQEFTIELPFSDMEIQALKVVAKKITGQSGVSDSAAPATASAIAVNTQQPKPLQSAPKKQGLNPIQAKPKAATPRPVQQQAAKPTVAKNTTVQKQVKKQVQSNNAPAKKRKRSNKLEDIVKEDIRNLKRLGKPASEMTPEELAEANKAISEIYKRPKPVVNFTQEMVNGVLTSRAHTNNLTSHLEGMFRKK